MLTKQDFQSDQETRWCPGCGDYAILASVQALMPELGVPPENRFHLRHRLHRRSSTHGTYGMHGIMAGRWPWPPASPQPATICRYGCVSGDGDALSIGGNHLIHALRRNVPIKLLLFNNQIYGLTKGQYSPTSEKGKITKSTPFGSETIPSIRRLWRSGQRRRSWRARSTSRRSTSRVSCVQQRSVQGSAFVEIYQNCNVFNDGAFDAVRGKAAAPNQIRLEHGKAIRCGTRASGESSVPLTVASLSPRSMRWARTL